MLPSAPPKKDASASLAVSPTDDSLGELKFISELGRSLLFTVHPKKVASRVAEAILVGVDAACCVFVAELESIGLISCAFGREGEREENFLRRERLEKSLNFKPPPIRYREIGMLGIPRDLAIGRNVFDVLEKYPQGRVREEFERAFRTGSIERIEQQTVADDGSTRHWMVSKVPMKNADGDEVTHVITVGEDVTVRVEAIHAISRAEKLAAVGRLAAG